LSQGEGIGAGCQDARIPTFCTVIGDTFASANHEGFAAN